MGLPLPCGGRHDCGGRLPQGQAAQRTRGVATHRSPAEVPLKTHGGELPPKSRSLATVINDLHDWEKVVEDFELCEGVITDNDRRTVLLKTLPSTVHSSLVSSLRKGESYEAMKKELDAEI